MTVSQTPIVRTANDEQEQYRGFAQMQMRILKEYMSLARLNIGRRIVTVDDVIIACVKCFAREDIFIDVPPRVAVEQAITIWMYFCVVNHKQPNGFSWKFAPSISIGLTALSEKTDDGAVIKFPAIFYSAAYVPSYDSMSIANQFDGNVRKSITYLSQILVPVSGWGINILSVNEIIEGMQYGIKSFKPWEIVKIYDKINILYQFVVPKSGYGANAYDTTEQLIYSKELSFDKGDLFLDETFETKAVVPYFFKELPGIEYFTFLHGPTKRYFQSFIDDQQYLYEYTKIDDAYQFVPVVGNMFTPQQRSVTYFADGVETDKEHSKYKNTVEYFSKFFAAENSDYIYRINAKISTFSPKVIEILFHYFDNAKALLLKDTEITVDKLLKSDFSVVQTYNLSVVDETLEDRRINKSFVLDDLIGGLNYKSDKFGFGANNYVVTDYKISEALYSNAITKNTDTFIQDKTDASTEYVSERTPGFCAVIPFDGKVIVSGGIEYPFIFGQYTTATLLESVQYPGSNLGNVIISDETVVCLLGAISGNNLKQVHESLDFMVLDSNKPVIPFLTGDGEYDIAGEYAIESLPRISSVIGNDSAAMFTCNPTHSYCQHRHFGTAYTGVVKVADGVASVECRPVSDLIGIDLNSLVKQTSIGETLGGTLFSGNTYFKETPIEGEYESKVYVVTKTEIVPAVGDIAEKELITEAKYAGFCTVHYHSGVWRADGANGDVLWKPRDEWSTINGSYKLFFDRTWSVDIINAYEGV